MEGWSKKVLCNSLFTEFLEWVSEGDVFLFVVVFKEDILLCEI